MCWCVAFALTGIGLDVHLILLYILMLSFRAPSVSSLSSHTTLRSFTEYYSKKSMLMSSSGQEWMDQMMYQQMNMLENPAASGGFLDSAVATTAAATTANTPPSTTTTPTGSPKSPFKPIRRRSRASKRTPTTVLNANTNNFRALVQQFTGCPSSSSFPFGAHRGPVNLSFSNCHQEEYSAGPNYSKNNNSNHSYGYNSTSYAIPNNNQPQLQLPQNYYHQGSSSSCSSMFSFNNGSTTTATVHDGFGSGPGQSALAEEEFQMDDLSLPELTSNLDAFNYDNGDEW